MSENQYILAMYDIRGKQEFIYKSSKIKEIVGASYIIRECFEDHLYPAAEEYTGSGKGIFSYKAKHVEEQSDPDREFSPEGFRRHIEAGYIGEVIYDGGGNFFVLYKDVETYREVNKRFYRKLLEGTYSLRVLTTYIDNIDFEDYREDQKRLYAKHREREREESLIHPINTLPIVQTDYRTSMPLGEMQFIGGKREKVSCESKRKYEKYEKVTGDKAGYDREVEGVRLLDEMITKKGEESLLAVIYIDGNSMGAKVEQCLNGLKKPDGQPDKSYSACVRELRRFSDEIQQHYITDRIEDVNSLLGKRGARFVIYAGDEVTFICNARNAYKVVKKYLSGLAGSAQGESPRTSCAGIAVFHSHAPFADAYRIAEECCESGKQLMKKEGLEHASLIDFHYCQGAFGTSLEAIRAHEENEQLSTPWLAEGEPFAGGITCEIVERMKKELNKAGRSNIKGLFLSAKKSEADFRSELERILAHQTESEADKKIDFTLGGTLDEQMQRRLIYDMVTVYDLWLAEDGQEDSQKGPETEQRTKEEGDRR